MSLTSLVKRKMAWPFKPQGKGKRKAKMLSIDDSPSLSAAA
jgi:hypothetical protein